MDDRRFDVLTKSVSAIMTRRGALGAFFAVLGVPTPLTTDAAARRRSAVHNFDGSA